jgi:hypothetical protein
VTLMKIDHPESARLYCVFALDGIFSLARLESFRMQPFFVIQGRQPEFPKSALFRSRPAARP